MYREFGVMLLKEDVRTWDDNPVKLFEWKDWGYKSWWEWLRDRDWLWATFPAVPGAMGGINALRQRGHFVECLTSKPEWAERQVWAWLTKWNPAFQQVTLAKLDEPKYKLSQADILVDDKPLNIEQWVASADDRLGILFDQPWNRDFMLPERVARVASWHGVLETISFMEDA